MSFLSRRRAAKQAQAAEAAKARPLSCRYTVRVEDVISGAVFERPISHFDAPAKQQCQRIVDGALAAGHALSASFVEHYEGMGLAPGSRVISETDFAPGSYRSYLTGRIADVSFTASRDFADTRCGLGIHMTTAADGTVTMRLVETTMDVDFKGYSLDSCTLHTQTLARCVVDPADEAASVTSAQWLVEANAHIADYEREERRGIDTDEDAEEALAEQRIADANALRQTLEATARTLATRRGEDVLLGAGAGDHIAEMAA